MVSSDLNPPGWGKASALSKGKLVWLTEQLRFQYGFMAYTGCELEWYFTGEALDGATVAKVMADVELQAVKKGLLLDASHKESGQWQYEVAFRARSHPLDLAEAVYVFKKLLGDTAAKHGVGVNFAAKPYADDYGSAMQVHVHLEDAAGNRLFQKQEDALSPRLADVLGGLLAILDEAMPVCAPTPESYARFEPKFNAPVAKCWGGNNRSVALRLPLKSGPECHIEYRVAGADADIASLLAVVLAGVLHGLQTRPNPGKQIHGEAWDAKYKLPRLAATPEEGMLAMLEGDILLGCLGNKWVEAVATATGFGHLFEEAEAI